MKLLNRLRAVRKASQSVTFTADEVELLRKTFQVTREQLRNDDEHAKLRALLGLIEIQIFGTVTVDWDAELARLTEGSSDD